MQFAEFLASLKAPYWAPNLAAWSLRGITCAKAVEAGKAGVANLIWLVATHTDCPAGMVYAKVMQLLPKRVDGHTLEHWAATGSLKLFRGTLSEQKGRAEADLLAMVLEATKEGATDVKIAAR